MMGVCDLDNDVPSANQEMTNTSMCVLVFMWALANALLRMCTKQADSQQTSSFKILIFCVTVQAAFKVCFNPILEEPPFLIDKGVYVKGSFKLQGRLYIFQESAVRITTAEVDKNPFESDYSDIVRGPNKPPKKGTTQQILLSQNDAKYFRESTVGSSRPYDAYDDSYNRHKPTGSGLLFKYRAFGGDDCERDNPHAVNNVTVQSVSKTEPCNASLCQNNLVGSNDFHGSSNQKNPIPGFDIANFKTASVNTTSQTSKGIIPVMTRDNTDVSKPHAVENSLAATAFNYPGCYLKPSYPVLVGNTVKTYDTKLFASLPQQGKYMVKQRVRDSSGATRVKLALKSSNESCMEKAEQSQTQTHMYGDDDVETDGNHKKTHYRGNSKKAGHIVYTCDGSFRGDMKYPLPNGNATNSKIGKGGNGFVFIIYHGKKQYAVKQTVYRPNEVNVHSALNHVNILPLLAVLMGEKHENHAGRFHCYHFMPKMDYDLRQILSTKEVGCLKYLYRNCSTNRVKFDRAFSNVKFILKETLKALSYIHSNGYVHRDVKASNIMIRMNCKCNPLYCDCSSKFKVKLGDFDSAGTIPGLGIKEPTDQMIKFASILPLGTPGYRAPEVSMHIVLSGPYETLYTTAVDMWSFGCLCLNICIGKTAAVKQREEALLLLSTTDQCFEKLWIKTTKINELEKTQPFSNDTMLLHLIRSCLRVDYNKRLSATDAQTYL